MEQTISPEFCLFSVDHWSMCMQKSEWSSWVQAIGSIAAIMGAAWIAGDQERKRKLALKQAAISKSRTFGAALAGAAEEIRERGGVALIYVRGYRAVLDELIQDSRGIASENLNLKWIGAVFGLRYIAIQMAHAVREAEVVDGKSGEFELVNAVRFAHMVKTVAELEAKTWPYLQVLQGAYPGVKTHEPTL